MREFSPGLTPKIRGKEAWYTDKERKGQEQFGQREHLHH